MFSIIVVSYKIKSHKSSRLHRKLNSVPGERAFEHFDSYNEQADGAEWGIFISSNNSNDAYDWGTYSWQTFDLFQLFLLNEVITKSYFSKYVCYFLESRTKDSRERYLLFTRNKYKLSFCSSFSFKIISFCSNLKEFFFLFLIFSLEISLVSFFRWMTNWLRCLEVD